MSIVEILLIGVSLSMDAFAVSITKGLSISKPKTKHYLKVGIYFGVFQSLMPFLGYALGMNFYNIIKNIDHWISFILLSIIGINMIKDFKNDEKKGNEKFDFKSMLVLSLATSMDAFVVGITFSFLNVNIYKSILIIGLTTFTLSMIGLYIGNKFKSNLEKYSNLIGGLILIFIGTKTLIEHLIIH